MITVLTALLVDRPHHRSNAFWFWHDGHLHPRPNLHDRRFSNIRRLGGRSIDSEPKSVWRTPPSCWTENVRLAGTGLGE